MTTPLGSTTWFTGLSGAGKTTVARAVAEVLREDGHAVELLDGDELRAALSPELGFSRDGRELHLRRVSWIASLLERHGVHVLVAAIAPYRDLRDRLRQEHARFLEVFVDAPLDLVEARDVKGLYRRARAGEIESFTGLSQGYEPPTRPDLHLRTGRETVALSRDRVLEALTHRGWLTSGRATAEVT
ncbi:MAG: adenylyl-sulfate kinase [Acidobacteriota bacterium]